VRTDDTLIHVASEWGANEGSKKHASLNFIHFNISKVISTLQVHLYYTNKEVLIITGWFFKLTQ
jgi:hypothetical protein